MGAANGIGAFTGFGSGAMNLYADEVEIQESIREELKREKFLEEQKKFSRLVTDRDKEILRKEGAELTGNQISAFAANGVDISGSALLEVANTQSEIENEMQAIRDESAFNLKVLNNEIKASRERRSALSSGKGMRRFGHFLGMFGGLASAFPGFGGNASKGSSGQVRNYSPSGGPATTAPARMPRQDVGSIA